MRLPLLLSSLILVGCGQVKSEGDSHLEFLMGSEWYIRNTHHEELVRLATQRFNAKIGQEILPVDAFGIYGKISDNPVVRGNYLTDNPDQRRDREYDLSKYYGTQDNEEIFWSETLQTVHFMRDKRDGEYLSTQENCERSVNSLRRDAQQILETWHSDRNYALQMMGHISHSVQDSASNAHVRREEVGTYGLKRIQDMCSFYPSTGHCNHLFNMEADNIWYSAWSGLFGHMTDEGNYDHIKATAQHAVDLTVEIWSVIYANVQQGPRTADDIDSFIKGPFETFLKDPREPNSGFYLCPLDS